MTDSPAFQLYPKDVLGGLAATYSLEEFGAFMLLLSFDWTLNGLPIEPEKLAKLLRVSRRKFAALWAVIGEQFPEAEGRRYNPLLQLQREKQAAWRTKSSEGGRASAAKRGARVVEPPLQPNGQPNGNIASAIAVKSKEPKGAAPPRVVPAVVKVRPPREPAPWMGAMRKAWTLGSLPEGAATQLAKVVSAVGAEEAAARMANYCEQANPAYATLHGFVSKHAVYASASSDRPGEKARVPAATESLFT